MSFKKSKIYVSFSKQTQWNVHGGKCGVCGDAYSGPYDHELGGKYYTDVIAGQYTQGQVRK